MGMLLEICEVEAGRLRDRFERCCDRETELLKGESCWERSSDSIDPVSISLDQLQPVLKRGVKCDFMIHADTSGTDVKKHTRFHYKKNDALQSVWDMEMQTQWAAITSRRCLSWVCASGTTCGDIMDYCSLVINVGRINRGSREQWRIWRVHFVENSILSRLVQVVFQLSGALSEYLVSCNLRV